MVDGDWRDAVDTGARPRLLLIEQLVDSARHQGGDLGRLLATVFPELQRPVEEMAASRLGFLGSGSPDAIGAIVSAVWRDTALIVASAKRQPHLTLDDREARMMARIAGTDLWFVVEHIELGRLHTFAVVVEGEPGVLGDIAGYTELSAELPGVEPGTLWGPRTVSSRVYPEAVTEYWIYANHGIDEVRGAPLMVWHDGHLCQGPGDLARLRMQLVTDNLAAVGLIPPMVHLLVSASVPGEPLPIRFPGEDQGNAMRSLQYDTVSGRYGDHLIEEVMPHAEQVVKLRSDGYSRGSAGISSGGACAFTLAWFHPRQFSRVHSAMGSFTALQWERKRSAPGALTLPNRIRSEPKRNIRVWMSAGSNDLEVGATGRRDVYLAGSWPLSNIALANALKLAGYDFHFRFGTGFHTYSQAALDLPESLAWLWRGYDPERTEQPYEQEPDEMEKPVFRVAISNRAAD